MGANWTRQCCLAIRLIMLVGLPTLLTQDRRDRHEHRAFGTAFDADLAAGPTRRTHGALTPNAVLPFRALEDRLAIEPAARSAPPPRRRVRHVRHAPADTNTRQ